MAQARIVAPSSALKLAAEYLNSRLTKTSSNKPPLWVVDEKGSAIHITCTPAAYLGVNPLDPQSEAIAEEHRKRQVDLINALNDASTLCSKQAIINCTPDKRAIMDHAISDAKAIAVINLQAATEAVEILNKITGLTWKIIPASEQQSLHFRYSSPQVDTEANKATTFNVRAEIDATLARQFPGMAFYKSISPDQRKGRLVTYSDLLDAINTKKLAALTPQVPNSGLPAAPKLL